MGSGEDEEKLKKMSSELEVDKYLYFLGYRNDIQNLMSQLDLIVLSSLWEGLPLTPIEAFSVGKTIIATAVDGTVEIVKDRENGMLIPPKKVDAISNSINYIIENPNIREKYENNAKICYYREFTEMMFYLKIVNYYTEVCLTHEI